MYKYEYIVYKTTNLINGKIYIGVHTNPIGGDDYLGCGTYRNYIPEKKGFPAAVKKYGQENFIRETLFTYEFSEEGRKAAYKKEAELVNRDFLKRKDVYNLVLGGKVPSSILEKEIAQYDLEGNFINHWDSISQAAAMTGIPDSSIQDACQKEWYSGEYQWRYYTNENKIEPAKIRTKIVYQFDLQGNYITNYKSLHKAAEITKIDYRAISQVCLNKTAQAGGYYWSYEKRFNFDPKKVKKTAVACYTDSGEFIKSYTSLSEAANDKHVSPGTLCDCIRGKKKHCAKLRWRYFYGNTSNIEPLT